MHVNHSLYGSIVLTQASHMTIRQALPCKQLTAKLATHKTLAAMSKNIVHSCYYSQLCNIP